MRQKINLSKGRLPLRETGPISKRAGSLTLPPLFELNYCNRFLRECAEFESMMSRIAPTKPPVHMKTHVNEAGLGILFDEAKTAAPLLITKNRKDPRGLLPSETSATREARPVAVKHGAPGRKSIAANVELD